MIYNYLNFLVDYAVKCNLIDAQDISVVQNRLIEVLGLPAWEQPTEKVNLTLDTALDGVLSYAVEKGIIEDGITASDLFDTKIMGLLTPMPSVVIKHFWKLYKKDKKSATDYYYALSQDTNYIRRTRVAKDQKWIAPTSYGDMEITINLSKPEKDPKAIAAALTQKQAGYPKCLLCFENEGFAGNLSHPARQNHRIIPVEMAGEKWGFQYSPYVYYNEHCIVFSGEHRPMKIDKSTFTKLLDFVKLFPHYFVGSNADLPIVGGSILTHEHFQGGNHTFAMAVAKEEQFYKIKGFEKVTVSRVAWPMSVIRLTSKSAKKITELSDKILNAWRVYSDASVDILASTNGENHNTITPIARMQNGKYQMDLVLRNNRTTEEFPMGIFHPHQQLHNIKKENIGLIEVMGLAVLPARLKDEFALLEKAILNGEDIAQNEKIKHHAQWAKQIIEQNKITDKNITEIICQETGKVFLQVLQDAGVFKRDENGIKAFDKFIKTI